MNYWKQFAEMLGVELGEEFKVKNIHSGEFEEGKFKITNECIMHKCNGESIWRKTFTTNALIAGTREIVKLSWKPKKGDTCWYYSIGWKRAISLTWEGEIFELCLWKCGNCFKTEEEAETKGKEIMEQIQKEFEEEQKC